MTAENRPSITTPPNGPLFGDNLSLDNLTLHTSPPPSLTARFGHAIFQQAGRGRQQTPSLVTDPEGVLTNFVQHLINSSHADSDSHLIAIGYELEALISIYSSANVKLCIVSSRPSSWNPNLPSSSTAADPVPHPHDLNPKEVIDPGNDAKTPTSIPMDYGRRGSLAWIDALSEHNLGISPFERIRYEVIIPAWEAGESLEGVADEDLPAEPPKMRVLVSLPPTYPNSSPPQLQLLGRYLGDFPIDVGLFGDITRTYISSSAVAFTPGDVCVFEGLIHAQSLARTWYTDHLSTDIQGEKARSADRQRGRDSRAIDDLQLNDSEGLTPASAAFPGRPSPSRATFSYTRANGHIEGDTPEAIHHAEQDVELGFRIFSSDPIVDRRSSFVGHAVKVTDEREVPLVIHELLSDRKIAKAAHPAIFAYRIMKDVGGLAGKVCNTDYDDDGESQAGSRLKHLLEILEVENVLVVVSRWYGGTLLGADRFKHINQAARDALELGGFLEDTGKNTKKERKK